jgi:ABC-type bacteriocin/lantibiotic exporter with double-glycine peptidase domain
VRRRRRLPQLLQLTQTECGLCCVLMILHFHGIKESFFALREQVDVGRDGASIAQMRAVLHGRGFRTRLFRANLAGLEKLTGPLIVYWEHYHFVVVERIRGDEVVVMDPAVGRRRLTREEFTESFSGVVLEVQETDHVDRTVRRLPSPWRHFLRPLLSSKAALAWLAGTALLMYAITLGVPLFTQEALDRHLGDGSSDVTFLVAGLAGGAAVYLVIAMGRVWATAAVSVRIGRAVMEGTFWHLLRLPYQFFSTRAPGELIYRLASVNAVRDVLSRQLVAAVLDAGLMLVVLGFVVTRSRELTLVMLAFVALLVLVMAVRRRAVSEAIQNENTELSRSQSLQLEAVMSIAAVKQAGGERQFFQRWSEVYGRSLQRLYRRSTMQGRIDAVVAAVQLTAPLVMLFAGLELFRRGELSIGTAVALQGLSATFFGLVSSVFGSFSQALVVGSFLDRLHDIVGTEPEPERVDGRREPLRGLVEVSGASFAYTRSGPAVLKDVTLTVRPGEKIGIVGRSGCGKTTLGKLLSGLFVPTTGTVRYDGHAPEEYAREAFYGDVGYVPQEIVLENRSIAENITMGRSGIAQDEIEAAARAAQVHEDITAMPMGYRTVVSEMGANLSGGQRQRIALARALVKRPAVLILDEATSSLDRIAESRISADLADRSCTRIVIAHRLSTIVDADRIVVLDGGSVVEQGTHDELMAAGGTYAGLFRTQLAAAG